MTFRKVLSLIYTGLLPLTLLACGSEDRPASSQPVTAVQESPASDARTEGAEVGNIGGTVTGPNGPEAGVWVIAETHDLATRYAKIVVTDDDGRYLIPDLPTASYDV